MPKKQPAAIYAYVVEQDGHRMYSRFFGEGELPQRIKEAESLYTGVVAIEKAHAGESPVWVRP